MGRRGRARIRRTPEELRARFREQYDFLQRSASAYDAGFEGEARRLAVVLRILLHDSSSSRSLLSQLKIKDALRFEDTALHPSPTLVSKAGLVMVELTTGRGVRHVAPLENLAPGRIRPAVPFERWWSPPVIEGSDGHIFSRRDLVLTMANQDGGAHIDPDLDVDYAALCRDSLGVSHQAGSGDPGDPATFTPERVTYGWSFRVQEDGSRLDPPVEIATPAEGNVAAASIRQMAYEVQVTFERRLDVLLKEPT
jgi:hypothetical protein